MKAILKAPIFTATGLYKKGDVIEVEAKDFDENLMEPAEDPEVTPDEEPAKKPGRKKKA